jgi:hypothetical protein
MAEKKKEQFEKLSMAEQLKRKIQASMSKLAYEYIQNSQLTDQLGTKEIREQKKQRERGKKLQIKFAKSLVKKVYINE